jgi:hypothetical protein
MLFWLIRMSTTYSDHAIAKGWMLSLPAVRHSFDTMMFRSIWGPCMHALGVVLEHAEGEVLARAALDGLQLAAR